MDSLNNTKSINCKTPQLSNALTFMIEKNIFCSTYFCLSFLPQPVIQDVFTHQASSSPPARVNLGLTACQRASLDFPGLHLLTTWILELEQNFSRYNVSRMEENVNPALHHLVFPFNVIIAPSHKRCQQNSAHRPGLAWQSENCKNATQKIRYFDFSLSFGMML